MQTQKKGLKPLTSPQCIRVCVCVNVRYKCLGIDKSSVCVCVCVVGGMKCVVENTLSVQIRGERCYKYQSIHQIELLLY